MPKIDIHITIDEEIWVKLQGKYNLSGLINNFLKHFKDGDFPNLEEVFAKTWAIIMVTMERKRLNQSLWI